MAYRRTERVVRRLNARRTAILEAAEAAAAEGGLEAVQIAAVAERAGIAAGTVYRYFPSKAELVRELIGHVSGREIEAIRYAAANAPGPLSAITAAITAFGQRIAQRRRLTWMLAVQPNDFDHEGADLIFRRALAAELDRLIGQAASAGLLPPTPDPGFAASAVIGIMVQGLLTADGAEISPDSARQHAAVQSLTLMALRALGVADARARGLVIQLPMPPGVAPSAVNATGASEPSSSAGSCA
jgi:AcrR family transcriptional regulator